MRTVVVYVSLMMIHAVLQLEEYEIAAKYCFSYLHLNPTDQLALGSAGFYRKHLNLTENDFIYQDSDIALYQEPYIKGSFDLCCLDRYECAYMYQVKGLIMKRSG